MKTAMEISAMKSAPPLQEVVQVDPEILGGTPCFKGTRVPIHNLFDHLEEGEPLNDFFEGFPSVTREQVLQVLETAKAYLITEIHENPAR